jgi:hypothetical protein
MGYAISWLAVKDTASELLLQKLALAPTGEMASYGESLFIGCTLPSGWFILFIHQCEHAFVKPKALALLSSFSDIIACSVEEHVTWSVSELRREGAQVWRIEHNAQESISHISTSGLLPEGYNAIEKKFTEQQRRSGGGKLDVDYLFEVPLVAARSIVGFKHDETDLEDGNFKVFKVDTSSPFADQKKKSWRQLW